MIFKKIKERWPLQEERLTGKEIFRQELAKKDERINLAYAALLFSACLAETFDPARYLARLDEIAHAVQAPVVSARTDEDKLTRLNDYLFGELGFFGNAQDYYNPQNSFLNKVLDLRTGIPISLSVIYIEIGWRLGLPLWGIGLPGHFIVGYGQPDSPIFIDVFNQGRFLSEDDCLAQAHVSPANRLSFREQFLRPVSKKAILHRMLLNLKHIYVRQEAWTEAYLVVDLILAVRRDLISEIRDRGLLAYQLHRLQDAVFDLNRYLFLAPTSPDADQLKTQIEAIEVALLRLN